MEVPLTAEQWEQVKRCIREMARYSFLRPHAFAECPYCGPMPFEQAADPVRESSGWVHPEQDCPYRVAFQLVGYPGFPGPIGLRD